MKNLLLLILLVMLNACHKKVDEEKKLEEPEKFYSGAWKTNDENPISKITLANLNTSKVFKISNKGFDDTTISQFQITTDGNVFPAKLIEGGSILIEGKSIQIKQIGKSTFIRGNWEIIQNEEKSISNIEWETYPQLNNHTLICSFETPIEFVLMINSPKPNDCADIKMTVFIDGIPVKNNSGTPMIFIQGNSFIGKGKIVEISVTENCNSNNYIKGEFKYKHID